MKQAGARFRGQTRKMPQNWHMREMLNCVNPSHLSLGPEFEHHEKWYKNMVKNIININKTRPQSVVKNYEFVGGRAQHITYIYKSGQTPDAHRTKPKLEACATRTA